MAILFDATDSFPVKEYTKRTASKKSDDFIPIWVPKPVPSIKAGG